MKGREVGRGGEDAWREDEREEVITTGGWRRAGEKRGNVVRIPRM